MTVCRLQLGAVQPTGVVALRMNIELGKPENRLLGGTKGNEHAKKLL